jgi:fimbrial isopeptide formation D2 family protein
MEPTEGRTAHVPAARRAIALLASALLIAASLLTTMGVARVVATDAPRVCGVIPVDLVFVIDRSGSMNTTEGALTRLGWAKLAATGLVDQFNSPAGSVGTLHQVGVSTFGGTSTTRNVQLGTSNAATVNAAINAIAANSGTPFDIGMAEGADNMLDGDRSTHNGVPVTQVLIFLSDGNPDPDSYAPSNTEINSYLASADKAFAVAIGPDGGNLGGGGTGVSYALMRQISKPGYVDVGNPGGFRAVTNASGLPNLFDALYEEIACPVGKLEVRKAINPTNDPGKFDLWIGDQRLANEVGHNGSTGEHELDAGAYVVGETADGETSLANYGSSISCVDTNKQNAPVTATQGQGASWTVNVTDASDIVCTITNARNTGTLTVTKVVKNENGGTAGCNAFGFKVNGGAMIGFEADCTNVLTLPTGSYSVTEPAVNGYDTSYANCSNVAVAEGQNATCTITNDDRPATLIVDKVLTTNDGSDATCDDFSFRINDGNAIEFDADCSNSIVVNAGTYSVVETDADGFTTGYANCSGIQIPNGGSATCTISNDDQPGTLIVNKVISGGDADFDDFSFRVNGGGSVAFEADGSNAMTVAAGTYSVIEDAAAGYDTSYANCSQVFIPNGGSATCTITNVRQTGSLTVVKDLSPSDDAGRFDLRIDGSVAANEAGDGGSTGAVALDTGFHTVGETADGETSLADYASWIECRVNGGQGAVTATAAGAGPLSVWIGDDANVVCVIHNTRVDVTIVKSNDAGESGVVQPGDVIHYELDVTVNDGTAMNVVVTDDLPAGLSYVDGSASPAAGFSANGQELTWTAGNLSSGTHTFSYDAIVDEDAVGALSNLGCVDADQNDELACDETTVLVQRVSIDKTSGVEGSVLPGTTVDFELTLAVSNGPIDGLTVVDQLPAGIGEASAISDGGTYDADSNSITWILSNVADGEVLSYSAVVSATAAAGEYTNVASITDGPCEDEECEDDETVVVRTPSLVVDKAADAESIVISGEEAALVATPSIVTWTLTYTLTDGPVTNVVITDAIPDGFVFLDAANGGNFADNVVTWTFASLSESGSVSFRTTVDPETISRAAPTVNTATIDSDETPEDEGTDSVSVAVDPPPQGGNPTPSPRPSLPDTAVAEAARGGHPVTVPTMVLVALLLGSGGALALATARSRRGRS